MRYFVIHNTNPNSIVIGKRTTSKSVHTHYRKKNQTENIVTDFKVHFSTSRFPVFDIWVGWVFTNKEEKLAATFGFPGTIYAGTDFACYLYQIKSVSIAIQFAQVKFACSFFLC